MFPYDFSSAQERVFGFLPGIFQGEQNLLLCKFPCYANFLIVFGPNFRGGKVYEAGKLPQGRPSCPLMEESQSVTILVTLTSRSDSNFERSNISLKENKPDGIDLNSNGLDYCVQG